VLACVLRALMALLFAGCAPLGPDAELEDGLEEELVEGEQALSATPTDDYARTRYPIVLVGGAFAFDRVLLADYWFGISEALREAGARVYVTDLSSAQSNEVRCEELFEDVERILALTGAEKINIVAHSQGAIAARYVAGVWPEVVASVTSVHGMNQGTHVAEELMEAFPERGFVYPMANFAASLLFSGLELFSSWANDGDYGSPSRVLTAQTLTQLSKAADRKNYAAFNALFPAGMPRQDCMKVHDGVRGDQGFQGRELENGIRFYSWMGTAVYTTSFDPLDQVIIRFLSFFMAREFAWDGMVPQCGANLGKVIRNDYPLNHGDAINQVFGSTPVDVPTLYLKHANLLANQGL
jgi:triacylglycerol lipase